MSSQLTCHGFFGSMKVAYFAADNKVGIALDQWTQDHVNAIRAFAERQIANGDTWVGEWVDQMVNEWQAKQPTKKETKPMTTKKYLIKSDRGYIGKFDYVNCCVPCDVSRRRAARFDHDQAERFLAGAKRYASVGQLTIEPENK